MVKRPARLEPVPTVDRFLAAPLQRYFIGQGYLVWCAGPTLQGSCHWGRLGRAELLELTRFLTWRPTEVGLDERFDMISDCARVVAVEPEAYQLVSERFPALLPNLAPVVRRLAFVHGGGFLGAVMAGVFPMAYGETNWQAFEDARAAFEWIGTPAAKAAFAEVAELIAHASSTPRIVDEVRRHLRACRGASTLVECARALGRSSRSLQRDLADSGVGFRAEVQRARIEAARQLLIESDLKLEAIAESVGFTSLPPFSRAFRQLVGTPPGEFREQQRRR
jgi:AraC-like DNA-binding protein